VRYRLGARFRELLGLGNNARVRHFSLMADQQLPAEVHGAGRLFESCYSARNDRHFLMPGDLTLPWPFGEKPGGRGTCRS
jgi:hypothetical protein